MIKEKQKAVRGLVSVSTVYSKASLRVELFYVKTENKIRLQTPEFGTPDAQLEVEQQVDELNNALRKSEVR